MSNFACFVMSPNVLLIMIAYYVDNQILMLSTYFVRLLSRCVDVSSKAKRELRRDVMTEKMLASVLKQHGSTTPIANLSKCVIMTEIWTRTQIGY